MIQGTMALLATGGVQAASFSEVLAATGAPRGSLYHHFPGGKNQLLAAAVDQAGALLIGALASIPQGEPAEAVVERFLAIWRAVLARSQCQSGCAVLAVTVAADSAELLATATVVFRAWRDHLASLLQAGGVAADNARRFAMLLVASVEGAVVLSRADQSLEPFEAVAQQLLAEARRVGQA